MLPLLVSVTHKFDFPYALSHCLLLGLGLLFTVDLLQDKEWRLAKALQPQRGK
jgi:hypothetical protein